MVLKQYYTRFSVWFFSQYVFNLYVKFIFVFSVKCAMYM